jgi:hypothetical protein
MITSLSCSGHDHLHRLQDTPMAEEWKIDIENPGDDDEIIQKAKELKVSGLQLVCKRKLIPAAWRKIYNIKGVSMGHAAFSNYPRMRYCSSQIASVQTGECSPTRNRPNLISHSSKGRTCRITRGEYCMG